MNQFLLPAQERLAHWRTFRRGLPAMDDMTRLQACVDYFAKAPMRKMVRDVDAPATWPTIWEMIHAGEWCRDSTAIGMDATLRMAGVTGDRMELSYVVDQLTSTMVLVLCIDAAWLLNYDWGLLTPRPTNLRTLRRYRWTGKGYTTAGEL